MPVASCASQWTESTHVQNPSTDRPVSSHSIKSMFTFYAFILSFVTGVWIRSMTRLFSLPPIQSNTLMSKSFSQTLYRPNLCISWPKLLFVWLILQWTSKKKRRINKRFKRTLIYYDLDTHICKFSGSFPLSSYKTTLKWLKTMQFSLFLTV